MAEAIRGPSPSSATLKATLLPSLDWHRVAHVLPDVATVTLFANLPGPALAESAFALSALRTNSRCTLERETAFGPVRLACEAWEELKNRLGELFPGMRGVFQPPFPGVFLGVSHIPDVAAMYQFKEDG